MESLVSHTHPIEHGSDRSFGIVFSVVFLVVGVLPVITGGQPRPWALALSAAFLLAAGVRPRLLNPLNRAWARFGMLLNRIVSPIALLIVYSAAVVPTSLVLRFLGKDPLHLKTGTDASSYWTMRTPPAHPDAQMKNQF